MPGGRVGHMKFRFDCLIANYSLKRSLPRAMLPAQWHFHVPTRAVLRLAVIPLLGTVVAACGGRGTAVGTGTPPIQQDVKPAHPSESRPRSEGDAKGKPIAVGEALVESAAVGDIGPSTDRAPQPPQVRPDFAAQRKSAAEAQASGSVGDVSIDGRPRRFDVDGYIKDPGSYVIRIEPSRVHQTAPDDPRYPQLVTAAGCTAERHRVAPLGSVDLVVLTKPGFPRRM